MSRLTLFFEPLDVLQFRDYRPFDAGFNVLGQSVFPLPGVFLGCVRAALFRDCEADFRNKKDPSFGIQEAWARELLGSHDRVGTLQLRGPLVARRQGKDLQPYFPMPADLVPVKDPDRAEDAESREPPLYTVLARKSLAHAPSQPRFYHRRPGVTRDGEPRSEPRIEPHGAPVLPWTHHELDKPRGGTRLLTRRGADAYIAAVRDNQPLRLDGEHAVPQDDILITEDRFGIARDPDRLTVEPQKFYLQRPYRLAGDHGFAIEAAWPDNDHAAPAERAIRNLDGRVVQLGGRGHRARITVIERGLVPEDLATSTGTGTLWFVTPVPLRPGLDSWPAGMTGVAERVQPIGGFNQAHRRPRPLLRALPAGTVVHAEAHDIHAVHKELCGFHGGATPDNESELARELERLQHAGFAMALPVSAERGES